MRQATKSESHYLTLLCAKASLNVNVSSLLVASMNDGGMGSLAIGEHHSARQMGSVAAELQTHDSDGVPVLFTLYLDTTGELFEMAVFKADFSETHLLKNT